MAGLIRVSQMAACGVLGSRAPLAASLRRMGGGRQSRTALFTHSLLVPQRAGISFRRSNSTEEDVKKYMATGKFQDEEDTTEVEESEDDYPAELTTGAKFLKGKYQQTANNRNVIPEVFQALDAAGKRDYLDRMAGDWYRLAVLSNEVYYGNPWSGEFYSKLVASFKGTPFEGRFRMPEGAMEPFTEKSIGTYKPGLWMANVGPAEGGGNYGEFVFRGTEDRLDRRADARLAAHKCEPEKVIYQYVGALVGFITKENITKMTITGHSLGGVRSAAMGLSARALVALMRSVEKNVDPKTSEPLDQIVLDRVKVLLVDPPGTTDFTQPGQGHGDAEATAALLKARSDVITTLTHSVTLISGHATPHIAPLNVFDKYGLLGLSGLPADEVPRVLQKRLKYAPQMHGMEHHLGALVDFIKENAEHWDSQDPSAISLCIAPPTEPKK